MSQPRLGCRRNRGRVIGIFMLCVLGVTLSTVIGCASLSQRIERLAQNEKYADARAMLEKHGAGERIEKDLSPDAEQARTRFAELVAERFIRDAESQLRVGNARAAQDQVVRGHDLCPWSERLAGAMEEHSRRVECLDQAIRQLRPLLQEEKLRQDDARRILAMVNPLFDYIGDSPELGALYARARNAMAELIAVGLREKGRDLTERDSAALAEDLTLCCRDVSLREELIEAITRVINLPKPVAGGQLSMVAEESILALHEHIYKIRPDSLSQSVVAPSWHELSLLFEQFCRDDLPKFLTRPGVSFSTVCLAEQLYRETKGLQSVHFEPALATAHITRARERAAQGKLAAIALVHIRRARLLSPGSYDDVIKQIETSALASLSVDLPIKMRIALDGNPGVEPDVFDMCRMALGLIVLGRTDNHWIWEWVPPRAAPDVVLYIDSGSLLMPSLSDVPEVVSSYLSHYQDIPNPAMQALEWTVSSRRRQMVHPVFPGKDNRQGESALS